MKGKILDYSIQESKGIISGDDGQSYSFENKGDIKWIILYIVLKTILILAEEQQDQNFGILRYLFYCLVL